MKERYLFTILENSAKMYSVRRVTHGFPTKGGRHQDLHHHVRFRRHRARRRDRQEERPDRAADQNAYAAALNALRTAVANLEVEHDYSGAPVEYVDPVYDPVTKTATDGKKVYDCTRDDTHEQKTVTIKSANYQKEDGYQALYEDIAKLPDGDPELTQEAQDAIDDIKEALDAISKNYDEDE